MTSDTRIATPLRRTSLSHGVADSLRAAILEGRLAAGVPLRQAALAREYGVSVIPLREALCQLEGEGLVSREPHHGVVVTDMNAEDIDELITICTTLESLAFERAVPKLSDQDLAEAEAALEQARGVRDFAQFCDLSWKLRFALQRKSDSPRLLHLLETLSKSNRRYFALFFHDAAARKWLLGQWAKLLVAARKRDTKAVLEHIVRSKRQAAELAKRLLPARPSERSKVEKKK
jgi:DNA-binding GntR family transcriptional regulator